MAFRPAFSGEANLPADLRTATQSSRAQVTAADDLPTVQGDPVRPPPLTAVPDRGQRRRTPGQVVVRVADNGIGIPPEERERVFEMFAQVDPRQQKGYGIGLSTCSRILDRHHGKITLEETPGGGISVCLTLPKQQ